MTIKINPAHKGMLHRELHVPAGQKIPHSKLEAAKHSSNPAERRRADFALNAEHFHHDAESVLDGMSGAAASAEPVQQHYSGMMRPTKD